MGSFGMELGGGSLLIPALNAELRSRANGNTVVYKRLSRFPRRLVRPSAKTFFVSSLLRVSDYFFGNKRWDLR
jgi:hypothetical protein